MWQKEHSERCLICRGDLFNCTRLSAKMNHTGNVARCRLYIFRMDDSSLSGSVVLVCKVLRCPRFETTRRSWKLNDLVRTVNERIRTRTQAQLRVDQTSLRSALFSCLYSASVIAPESCTDFRLVHRVSNVSLGCMTGRGNGMFF